MLPGMITTLTVVGDRLALVLDPTLLEQLRIDADTPLEVVTFVPLAGAGTASEGSTSAPVPQGIAGLPLPLGWSALAGAVVWPLESAMAKRVVQYVAVELGDVNW